MTVEELVTALEELGVRFVVSEGSPKAYPPSDPGKRKRFQELMPWLSQMRDAVLAHFQPGPERVTCPLCRRDVTDPEDRERLLGVNPFCSIGGLPPGWDRMKQKPTNAVPGCPYRGTS